MNLRSRTTRVLAAIAVVLTAVGVAPGVSPATAAPSIAMEIHLTAGPGPVKAGDRAFSVSVFSPDGGRPPTGPVTVRDGEKVVWEGSLVYWSGAADRVEWTFDNPAYLQWVLIEPGVHTLQASYAGDDLYAAAASEVATVTVERRPVQAKIFTYSDHAYGYGHPVVVAANLDFLAAPPSGTITLRDNGAVIAQKPPTGQYSSFVIRDFAVGDHTLSFDYSGDVTHEPAATRQSATFTVPKVLAGMTLRLSIDPTPEECRVSTCTLPVEVVWGRPIDFEARLDPYLSSLQQPRPPDGLLPTGTVTFFDLNAVLGTVPVMNGVARFTASFRPRGDHEVYAEYSGDAVFRGSSTRSRRLWAGTPTGTWAAAFLEDFFGAPPRHDEANGLGRAVDEHGQSRLRVAAGIANGHEHRQHLVDELHRRLLGRPADQGLLVALAGGHVETGWDPTVPSYRPGLMGQGHILETVEALLFGTEEYYIRVGRTPDAYVENLWLQTVQRPITPAERSVVLGWLRSGLARTTLAQAVLYSVDYRRVQARILFQRFFGRPGDPAGVDAWTRALQRGVRIEDAMAAFVDTGEFLRLHGIPHTAP